MAQTALTLTDHDRASAGLRYVYPVVSRRAAGLSVGINLNPNNACNWACVYCQVPDLRRGTAPVVDIPLLRRELAGFLHDVVQGDFLETRVPEGLRRLNDIALSGNGEPTSAREFPAVVDVILDCLEEAGLRRQVRIVLITNGSLAGRPNVQEGLRRMATARGEVWFKVDRVTPAGLLAVNRIRSSPVRLLENLRSAAACCPTWIQTCQFAVDGQPPDRGERDAYLEWLAQALASGVRLQGVLLYGLARPSLQPGAERLGTLTAAWFEAFAQEIRRLGLPVKVTP